jgi:hypothetical protein
MALRGLQVDVLHREFDALQRKRDLKYAQENAEYARDLAIAQGQVPVTTPIASVTPVLAPEPTFHEFQHPSKTPTASSPLPLAVIPPSFQLSSTTPAIVTSGHLQSLLEEPRVQHAILAASGPITTAHPHYLTLFHQLPPNVQASILRGAV